MPGHAKPVSPRPVLPCLVNKRLAHIEHNRIDHPRILRARFQLLRAWGNAKRTQVRGKHGHATLGLVGEVTRTPQARK